ncbi:hypothetical protein BH10ACI1_BH10ACI1_29990 [soil metagenome]
MKKVLFLFLISVFVLNVFARTSGQNKGFDLPQFGVRIEPDKRLMVVLASLEAAGLETPLTAKGEEFRQKLRADLKGLDSKLVEKMQLFVKQYKNRYPNKTDAEIIAPFISMAYALSPVPDLAEPTRTEDLPGNLLDVLDFSPLVREFYRTSTFKTNLDAYLKEYEQASIPMQKSTEQMVRELLGYMHTKPQLTYTEKVIVESKDKKKTLQKTEYRDHERRFFIVPELLAPKGAVSFVNAGDDYYAIVPPDIDLGASEVRRAYLQFVLDPLVLTYAKEISGFREGIKALLDERRKTNPNISPDIFLAVSRSLVSAVDARQAEFEKTVLVTSQARQKINLMKTDDEKRAVSAELTEFKKSFADDTALQLSQDYENGAVLAFYFAAQLKGTEESGFDIASSLRDIILSLQPSKEMTRLTEFADARARAIERRKTTTTQMKVIDNPVTVKLLEIDKNITAKNYPQAEAELKKLLTEYPTESPRIYYVLGRLASLSAESLPKEDEMGRNQKLLEAKVAYSNVLRSATETTDPALISLSYLGLGRIYEFYDQTEYALKIYEKVIEIGNIEGGAYKEAVEAKARLTKK